MLPGHLGTRQFVSFSKISEADSAKFTKLGPGTIVKNIVKIFYHKYIVSYYENLEGAKTLMMETLSRA